MNFRQLSSEELEPMAHEFSLFLSANGIDAQYWQKLKAENNEAVHLFVKQFSDSVWFKIFANKRYLDFEDEIFFYYMDFLTDHCIIVKSNKTLVGAEMVLSMMEKKYEQSREEDMYQWTNHGAQFSDGKSYKEACLLWAKTKIQ